MITKEELLKKNVGFISLGCDKNRVDLEKIIFKIKTFGFNIVNDCNDANIIIIPIKIKIPIILIISSLGNSNSSSTLLNSNAANKLNKSINIPKQ